MKKSSHAWPVASANATGAMKASPTMSQGIIGGRDAGPAD